VVLNGDSLLELRLVEVVERHRERGAVATMVVRPDPDAERYGLVELDADDRVRRVAGQPPGAPGPLRPFMFPGLQVFESTIFDWMDAGAAFSVTRVTYPRLLKAGAPFKALSPRPAGSTLTHPERSRRRTPSYAGNRSVSESGAGARSETLHGWPGGPRGGPSLTRRAAFSRRLP